MSRSDTAHEIAPATGPAAENAVPREEILAVAARSFRDNHDAYHGLGYQYVVLRGERLVAAGTTPEGAWAKAEARGVAPEEAFCASVIDGCPVHPF